jgi:hypothetical protein
VNVLKGFEIMNLSDMLSIYSSRNPSVAIGLLKNIFDYPDEYKDHPLIVLKHPLIMRYEKEGFEPTYEYLRLNTGLIEEVLGIHIDYLKKSDTNSTTGNK